MFANWLNRRRGWLACALRELLNDLEQFGAVIAALAAELDELDRLGEQRAALGRAGDTDSMAGAQFEQSFVAQKSQGA